MHDTLAVRSTPKETWIDFILPKLDVDKMVDEKTGLPFTDKTLRKALEQVYENIADRGNGNF